MIRFLLLLLNVLGFWLAADPANAAPVAVAISAISTAIKAAGFLGVILKAVLGLGISYGLSLLQKALAKRQKEASRGVQVEVKMGDDQPISFVIGKYATAGKRKYIGTWGKDGGTPNAYLTDVTEIGFIPNFAGERGITSLWIDDQLCSVLWDEPHPDGRGFPIAQFRVGTTPKDFLWIKFLDGTQTVADPFLVSKFGADPDRPWKSTMVGRGCQAVILTARYNADLFSGIPNAVYEPHPMPLYDLRKDSTSGGSGAHRWSDPSTWEPSVNAQIIAYNVTRGIYYNGDWIVGGQNLAAFRLPPSNWMAAINECDASIANADGSTEPQFRAGLEISGDMEPLTAIDDMRQASNGRVAEVGGIFKALVGAPGAAVYSFTDDDIVVTQGQSFEPFPSLADLFNGIEATYPEPAEKWANKDAPARYSDDLEVEDGNRRLATSINFIAVPFGTQVQRLMKAMIDEERRFRQHNFYLPPDAYPLEPNDVVAWTSARNGYNNKKFLITRIEGQPTFNQLVYLKEIDPSDYDWMTSYQLPTATGWMGVISAPAQPMYGWQVEPATLDDADGVPWRPTIQVSCAPDQDDVAYVWVKVRLAATQDIVFDSQQTVYGYPYAWKLNANFKGNTDYEAQGKLVPFSQRQTDWSEWLAVRTPNIATDDLVIDLAHAKKDILNRFSELQREAISYRPVMEQLLINASLIGGVLDSSHRELTATVGESNAMFSEDIRVVTDGVSAAVTQTVALSATVADNKATADSQIAVLTTNDSAQASQLNSLTTTVANNKASADSGISAASDAANAAAAMATSLNATVGANSAGGLVKFAVAANQNGATARFSIAIRANTSASYVESGMFIEIYDSGGGVLKSRFSVLADQFSVLNPDGSGQTFLPLVFQGGVLKLQGVKVQWADIENANITWANIQSAVVNNFVATSANVGNLIVGTSNLGYSSVTASASNSASGSGPGGTGSETDFTVIGTFTINNENPSAIMTQLGTSFQTVSASSTASRNAYVQLYNATDNVVVRQYQLTAGPQSTANFSQNEFLLAPAPASAGVKTYQIRISRYAFSVSMTVLQQWWKR